MKIVNKMLGNDQSSMPGFMKSGMSGNAGPQRYRRTRFDKTAPERQINQLLSRLSSVDSAREKNECRRNSKKMLVGLLNLPFFKE